MKPTDPHWERITELFEELSGLPVAEQTTRLRALAAEDAELASTLQSLLDANAPGRADVLLDSFSAAPPAEAPEPDLGSSVGPFILRERLGSGGMGTVFLAVRDTDAFEQRAAVKVLHSRRLGHASSDRFETERRILARLEHPGIARLIDGGVDDQRRAFIALEYVDGLDVVRHCQERSLPLPERLRLMQQACEAVTYAHRQLVVHRDLKPSNVMVTKEGRLKLLDFGIAKLLEEPEPGVTPALRTAPVTVPWMTPEYASPEQIDGHPTTTSTDIYQLGVLLYEVITGTRPHATTEGRLSPHALAQAILTTDPIPPSKVGRTRDQGAPIAGDADLDAIVLKAMHRDPSRRYTSAESLGRDLARYLNGETVEARPDSWAYRARKFTGRNRFAVAAGALAIVSLVLGFGVALSQAAEARAQRDEALASSESAERLSGLLLDVFRLSDPRSDVADTISASELLNRAATRIDEQIDTRPSVQFDLLMAIAGIEFNLGLYDRAAERAGTAAESAVAGFGETSREVADAWLLSGASQYEASRFASGDSVIERSIAVRRELGPAGQDSMMVEALLQHWRFERTLDNAEAADTAAAEANRLALEVLGEGHPMVAEIRLDLAASSHDVGDFTGAEEWYRLALESFDRSETGEPTLAEADALATIGQYTSFRGEYAEAVGLQESAWRIFTELLGEEHPESISAGISLAGTLQNVGRWTEALELGARLESLGTQTLGPTHARVRQARQRQMQALLSLGRFDEARAAMVRVRAIPRAVRPGRLSDIPLGIPSAHIARGLGEFDVAEQILVGLDSIARTERGGAGFVPQIATARGDLAVARGDRQLARVHYDTALAATERALRPGHRFFDSIELRVGEMEGEDGDWGWALNSFEAILERTAIRRVEGSPTRVRLLSGLVMAHCQQGDREAVQQWLAQLRREVSVSEYLSPGVRGRAEAAGCPS